MPVWAWNVLSIVCLFGFSYDLQVETWYISSTLLHFYKRLSWGWGGHKQNSIIMKINYKNLQTFCLLTLFCSFAHPLKAVDFIHKHITVTIGESFIINPKNDANLESGYKCLSTYIEKNSDPAALSINEASKTTVQMVPFYNDTYQTGFFCTYKVDTYKTGDYEIVCGVRAFKKEFSSLYDASYYITYHISVVEKPKVVSIAIPNTLTLTVGEGYTFSPIINEPGAETTLSWYSSNQAVATVSPNGMVSAISTGTTSITCIADNGVSAQCFVTVNAFVDPLPAVKDTTVNLTVTVGIPFVITPIHELNIAGGDASTPTPYVLSDPSACTVTYTDCPGWNENIYRIYTITPERAGVFVFKETCSCTIGYPSAPSGIYTKIATATYIVNAVEALPTVLGDMDGDGKVTVSDVTKVIDIYLEGTGE